MREDAEASMDHARIDSEGIAERYGLGQLAPEEARRFEEHSLDCAECLERLELVEQLRQGLTRAAVRRAEIAAAAAPLGPAIATLGLLAAWSHLRRRWRFAVGGAALVLLAAAVGLPTALLLGRAARLDRQLAAARQELARRQAPVQVQAQAPLQGEAQAQSQGDAQTQARSQAEIQRLAGEVAAGRAQAARLGAELEGARAPQVNVPILALSLLRSAPGAVPPPRPALRVPPAAPWVVISLEPSDPGFPRYRAVLLGPDGRAHWQNENLVVDPEGLLSFSLPRSLLAPGNFTVRVDGLPAGRPATPAGDFPFQVMP